MQDTCKSKPDKPAPKFGKVNYNLKTKALSIVIVYFHFWSLKQIVRYFENVNSIVIPFF